MRLAVALLGLVLVAAAGAQAPASDPDARIAYAAGGQIHVAAADGSGSRAVTRGGAPSWSPDGTMIAFHSARVPRYGLDVYVMNRNGRDQRRLVTHPTAGGEPSDNTRDDLEPTWSPDGFFIAFATLRDGNAEIYRMDTTGHATARLTNNPAEDRDPAWSPDGRSIAFVSTRSGNEDVYVMLFDSTEVRQVTRTVAPDRAPAWSPDGSRLAFESVRDGNADVYVIGADGSGERRLTTDPAAETRPTWSPDARSIVFTRSDEAGRRLVVASALGGAARPLTAPDESTDAASWQPGVDLALSLTAASRLRRGEPARIRLALRNRLPAPAFNAALSITIPKSARVVSVRARGASCRRARRVRCTRATPLSSRVMSVTLTLRPGRCGRFTFRGAASALQRDVRPENNRRSTRVAVRC